MVLAIGFAFLKGTIKWLYCNSESVLSKGRAQALPFYFETERNRPMNFTIKWRFFENGDFFEQDYTNKKSIAYAAKDWRKAWEMHESECAFFQITKI
jgi:hypothetical protein